MSTPQTARLLGLFAISAAPMLGPGTAAGCGWWGDSVNEPDDAVVVSPDGSIARQFDPSDADRMARLSKAYRLGQTVPHDLARARYWAERAAKADHAGAMNDLGQMLEAGLGGPSDVEGAAFWFREAAERGIAGAQHSLATMLRDGHGVARDPSAAETWLRRSAASGHGSAAAGLANMIWSDRLTARTAGEGWRWWLVALSAGHGGGAERCFAEEPGLSEETFNALRAEIKARGPVHRNEPVVMGGES